MLRECEDFRICLHVVDTHLQYAPQVAHLPVPPTLASFTPIIIAVFGDFEDLAHAQNRKLATMLIDELKFYG